MDATEVVTFGEAMGLFLVDGEVPLARARRFVRQVAGAELNVAVGLARLGHRCAWLGRVGDDAFGEDVIAVLRAEGIDATGVVVDPGAPTGLLVRDRHGERRVRVHYHRAGSAGSRLAPADLDIRRLAAARLVHLTGITPALSASARAATFAAADAAHAAGVPLSFDVNFRARLWDEDVALPVLRDLAARASIVLASAAEASWLSGHAEPAAAAHWFGERGAGLVAIRRGAAGAHVRSGSEAAEVPAFPVAAPVDPVGAGDAFTAGFLSAWLRGDDPRACGRAGAAAGAACVQVPGDLDGLPTRAELGALLAGDTDVDR